MRLRPLRAADPRKHDGAGFELVLLMALPRFPFHPVAYSWPAIGATTPSASSVASVGM